MTLFEKGISMQIILFHAHYQSVHTNFDISSFSLISCNAKPTLLPCKRAAFGTQLILENEEKSKLVQTD